MNTKHTQNTELTDAEIQTYADNANRVLVGTPYKAVANELIERYGENEQDGVDKESAYYLAPMYDGYIEDAEGEEIGERAGCYCDLESVEQELVCLAQKLIAPAKAV